MDQYATKRLMLRLSAPFQRRILAREQENLPDVLFIWIPKSAGTSCFATLETLGMVKIKSLDKARLLFPGKGMVTFVHQSVSALLEAGAVSRDFVERAFRFTFVRNPYERCASLLRYYLKMNRIPADMTFPRFLDILQEEWDKHPQRPPLGRMSDRLRYYGEEFDPRCSAIHPVGAHNSLEWSQCRPQVDWLDGLPDPDATFIARVENLEKDFQTILGKIRELAPALSVPGLVMPRLNTTHSDAREDFYRDPAHRRIVETLYAEDFVRFSY